MRARVIDLENHFITPAWLEALSRTTRLSRLENGGERLSPEVWSSIAKKKEIMDLGEGRIAAMDEAHIDFAYLSLTSPGVETFPVDVGVTVAEDANNVLAEAIARYPDRLGGWATLAPRTSITPSTNWSVASPSWASKGGTRSRTSATLSWTILRTGPSWPSAKSWTSPSTFILPFP